MTNTIGYAVYWPEQRRFLACDERHVLEKDIAHEFYDDIIEFDMFGRDWSASDLTIVPITTNTSTAQSHDERA